MGWPKELHFSFSTRPGYRGQRFFRAKVDACFDEESEAAADDQSGTDMDTKADDDGTFSLPGACFDEDDEQEGHSQKTKASSATASEPSEYDDGYLDNVASDDSLWAFQVDEDGRSALDPAGKFVRLKPSIADTI